VARGIVAQRVTVPVRMRWLLDFAKDKGRSSPYARQSAGRVSQYSAEALSRAHNLVERFFNKIKRCQRIATRYDKLAANYLAFVKLAATAFGCVFMSPRPI
jgi:transposase